MACLFWGSHIINLNALARGDIGSQLTALPLLILCPSALHLDFAIGHLPIECVVTHKWFSVSLSSSVAQVSMLAIPVINIFAVISIILWSHLQHSQVSRQMFLIICGIRPPLAGSEKEVVAPNSYSSGRCNYLQVNTRIVFGKSNKMNEQMEK